MSKHVQNPQKNKLKFLHPRGPETLSESALFSSKHFVFQKTCDLGLGLGLALGLGLGLGLVQSSTKLVQSEYKVVQS